MKLPKILPESSKKLPVKTWLWQFSSSETPAVSPAPGQGRAVGMQAEPPSRLPQGYLGMAVEKLDLSAPRNGP